jgi:hypothetical protein
MTNGNNNGNKPVDARALTLPIITMISIIGFFMWVTYIGTNQLSENKSKLTSIENTLVELKEEIRNIKSSYSNYNSGPGKHLTPTDMAIFCLRAQIVNKDWRCPSVNHTYDTMNQMNDTDILREIQRLNRREGERSPLDKDLSPPPPKS